MTIGGLQVATVLQELLENQIAPGTGVEPAHFWAELETILNEFVPRNRELLAKRDALQAQIDEWHRAHAGQKIDEAEYTAFLKEIGYLLEEGPDFEITTQNVDAEIALTAGPQLVVPIMNARFSLNAANTAGAACMMRSMAQTSFRRPTEQKKARAITLVAAPG